MWRTIFTFGLLYKRRILALVVLLVCLYVGMLFAPWYVGLVAVVAGVVSSGLGKSRRSTFRLWKFAWRVREFYSARAGRVRLRFSPELSGRWDLQLVLACCRQEFERLATTFADVRVRRCAVFLFPSAKEIGQAYGRVVGGFALPAERVVVIGIDDFLRESLRHELVHLFAGEWNPHPPLLLQEGLAVHLQGSRYGQALDKSAIYCLGAGRRRLTSLLEEGKFFCDARRHANYTVAGSFTGFLIRRFGWQKYRLLYRAATAKNFESTFQSVFSLTLEEAEAQWRSELFITGALLAGVEKAAAAV
jgi:hypothetical protein